MIDDTDTGITDITDRWYRLIRIDDFEWLQMNTNTDTDTDDTDDTDTDDNRWYRYRW
jgi:hypothetical protein